MKTHIITVAIASVASLAAGYCLALWQVEEPDLKLIYRVYTDASFRPVRLQAKAKGIKKTAEVLLEFHSYGDGDHVTIEKTTFRNQQIGGFGSTGRALKDLPQITVERLHVTAYELTDPLTERLMESWNE